MCDREFKMKKSLENHKTKCMIYRHLMKTFHFVHEEKLQGTGKEKNFEIIGEERTSGEDEKICE